MLFAKLLPRSAPYFSLFQRQNSIMREMTSLLIAVATLDHEAEANLKRMGALEVEADDVHHIIIHELSQTFITPIDREDIYAIATAQERTIDSIHSLGRRFFLFSSVPGRFPARRMVANMQDMTEAFGDMLLCLTGKSNPDRPVKAIQMLKENNEMLLGAELGELYDLELDSLEQVRRLQIWTQLYEHIEQTAKLFADMTDTLEQAVLKYA